MNKIPMNITIVTRQQAGAENGEPTDPVTAETSAFGFLKSIKDGIQLEYLENAGNGYGNILTTVSMLDDKIVSVNKIGALNSYMVFEEGKSHTCVYDTDPLPLQLRIQTKKLKNNISPLGGKLDIDYTVEIAGNTAEKSHISMSVSPHESIITS